MAHGVGLTILVSSLAWLPLCCEAETITGYIYCDNHFEFYFNGVLIKEDPLAFTPHNAVKVSFEYDGTSSKTYAIMCQDYASESGYEYISTSSPKLGDGSLLAEFSDGTKTSSDWKVYTATFGPTDASVTAGCTSSNLDVCAVEDRGMPDGWALGSFDDSSWGAATEYTTAAAGWGRTPSYSDSKCGTITSPLTKENADPSSQETTEDECLNPRTVLCGGDESCTGDVDGRMIWGADLERDNKVLFRYSAAAPSPATAEASTAADTTATGTADATTTGTADTDATTTATGTAGATTAPTNTTATADATTTSAATATTANGAVQSTWRAAACLAVLAPALVM